MIKLSISEVYQQLKQMKRNAELAENEYEDLLDNITEEVLDNGDIEYTLEIDPDELPF